ncbi:MAG: nicotinate-nucleotide adenylyltransferase [Candidatus Kapaibacterium sp.]
MNSSIQTLSGVASVGVFGGTFDPIHTGHLILAERAREELNLEAILFMPAHIPPHKSSGRKIASGTARLEMIRLSIADNPHFYLTDLELEREGISFTVDSLRTIGEVNPEIELTLLMGSDNARDFTSWREPESILQLADIAVWERPGSYYWPEIYPDYIARKITSPLIEISSTEIRNRVAAEQSIRYLTPEPVISYIRTHGLYL